VTAIPVDVNETTVIRLILDEPFAPSKKLQQDRWYATDTAIASDGKPLSFNIKVEQSKASTPSSRHGSSSAYTAVAESPNR
jgi:hypothetical protein